LLEWKRETGSILSKEAAMKHYLSSLCLALVSFFYVNEAAANLLLKQNPTPLEPASYSVSGESYQIAKVTWLPDYLGNNKSHGGERVDNGGKDVGSSTCEKYGYVGSCGDGQTGTKVSVAGLSCYKNCKAANCKEYGWVSEADCPAHKKGSGIKHPVSGLTCYEKCVCDTSYYKYSASNCALPKLLGGEQCIDIQISGETSEMVGGSGRLDMGRNIYGDAVESSRPGNFTTCACPSAYSLSSCPANANCTQCDSKYKISSCKEGYILSGNECVLAENCSAYPLTVCPAGGICSKCPDNNAKLKIDSCDASKGWKLSGNTCAVVDCPAGYTAGVASCLSTSTKPDYSSNGYSGGLPCGLCKCSNVNSNCTAANYPVTTIPLNATQTESCTTGCGSEKVTRYKFKCNLGYVLKNNKCECSNTTDCSGYTLTSQSDSNANYDSCSTGCGSAQKTTYKITGCKTNYKLVGGVCKSDVCTSGEKNVTCSSSQNKVVASTTDAGTACYKCENKNDECPSGYQKTACNSSSTKQTDVITTEAGTKCYQCLDCLEYAAYLGKTVVYEDEYHKDLLYDALVSGTEDIYVYGTVWLSNRAVKACYTWNHTCSLAIHFHELKDLDPICKMYDRGELKGDLYIKAGDRIFDIRASLSTVEISEAALLEFNNGGRIENFTLWGSDATIRVNHNNISMVNASVNGRVYMDCNEHNLIVGSLLYTQWCVNQSYSFDCGICIDG